MSKSSTQIAARQWNTLLAPFRRPDPWRSWFQIANTALPFFLAWALMFWSLSVGYWLTLILAFPTAGLLLRLFIIQHDCGHGSFFRSQRVADAIGFCIGVLTLVPYSYWRRTHAIHHATSGDLDHRSFGDIDTLTVNEYLGRSRIQRFTYRLYRHPLVLLGLGPIYQFVLKHRLPIDVPRRWKREWASVHFTNMALAGIVAILCLTVGWQSFLLVQIPITVISGAAGVFLFYAQHQYEDTYWRRAREWDFFDAGLQGSSHMVMPKVMQWFTGNIGLHHIHHIASKIPNYKLQRAFDHVPELQRATRLTLWESVKTLNLTLWDEEQKVLVGFRDLKRLSPG